MWPYWALFMFPAMFALQERYPSAQTRGDGSRISPGRASLWLLAPVLTLFIGLRDQVGGDWWNYLGQLQQAYYSGFADAMMNREPGYELLQWLAIETDWGIYGVNFVAAALFTVGLLRFCLALPRPWLAIVAATPYLVIVVSMGYTRQGLALGLSMIGLLALERRQPVKFGLWVLFAAAFHNSAIMLLPIAFLAGARRKLTAAMAVVAAVGIGYAVSFEDSIEQYAAAYVDTDMVSEGALVRLSMNVLPALCLLIWRRRMGMSDQQLRLWIWFSIISISLFGAYFIIPASTALDRIALYMLPLQLVVFAFLPDALRGPRQPTRMIVWPIVGYYAVVLFVWLNYANHASYWLPYRFYPFELASLPFMTQSALAAASGTMPMGG